MFTAMGWCFPWTIAAMAGTNVCLRRVEAAAIFNAIRDTGFALLRRPIVHAT